MTIEPQQLEFPVSIAQAIFEACMDSIDIQNELYCQLIKQTSPHPPAQHKPSLPVKVCGQSVLVNVSGQSVLVNVGNQSVLVKVGGQSVFVTVGGQSVLVKVGGQSVGQGGWSVLSRWVVSLCWSTWVVKVGCQSLVVSL